MSIVAIFFDFKNQKESRGKTMGTDLLFINGNNSFFSCISVFSLVKKNKAALNEKKGAALYKKLGGKLRWIIYLQMQPSSLDKFEFRSRLQLLLQIIYLTCFYRK